MQDQFQQFALMAAENSTQFKFNPMHIQHIENASSVHIVHSTRFS